MIVCTLYIDKRWSKTCIAFKRERVHKYQGASQVESRLKKTIQEYIAMIKLRTRTNTYLITLIIAALLYCVDNNMVKDK